MVKFKGVVSLYSHKRLGWEGRGEREGEEGGEEVRGGGVDGSAREERMRQSGRGRTNKLMIYRVWYRGAYNLTDV